MPSYADVICGRILLREKLAGPEALFAALHEIQESLRLGSELSLAEALERRAVVPRETMAYSRSALEQAASTPTPSMPRDPVSESQSLTRQVLAAASTEPRKLTPEECPIYGYEILAELGKGAMGVVYKARHIFTDRLTA